MIIKSRERLMRTSRLRQSLCVFRMCCLSLASSLRISFSWGTQRLCTAPHRKSVVQDWLLAAATEARPVSSLFFVFASLSLSLSLFRILLFRLDEIARKLRSLPMLPASLLVFLGSLLAHSSISLSSLTRHV